MEAESILFLTCLNQPSWTVFKKTWKLKLEILKSEEVGFWDAGANNNLTW